MYRIINTEKPYFGLIQRKGDIDMIAAVRDESIKNIVAANIRFFLKQKNKTRKELCEDLDIKYTTFCDWVNGKSVPKLENLEAMSIYFEISIEDFFMDDVKRAQRDKRLKEYERRLTMLDISLLDKMSDEQVRELLRRGFTFKHRTLQEYVELNGGKLVPSKEYDWGEPVGDEIW